MPAVRPMQLPPREPAVLALRHRDTDRVPVDFIAAPEAWNRLQHHLSADNHEAVPRRLGIRNEKPVAADAYAQGFLH
jgi:hypothetical protein